RAAVDHVRRLPDPHRARGPAGAGADHRGCAEPAQRTGSQRRGRSRRERGGRGHRFGDRRRLGLARRGHPLAGDAGSTEGAHEKMLKTILFVTVLMTATGAGAQNWPTRPIQLVVPYAPGGVVDFIGRTLGQRLAQQVGQPVVIDNRPGAGGMIGIEYTARSAPDGHTIVLMDPAVVINPVLQEKPLYDLFKDLATVAVIGHSPLVLTVNPQLPA